MRRFARRYLPRALHRWLRMGWYWLRSVLPGGAPVAVPGLPGLVHRQDNMMFGFTAANLGRYVDVGHSAMENIHASREAAGAGNRAPRRVLDFPSGYGRVLRHMHAAWPDAHFTAGDLDPIAVRFCAKEFGATPLISNPDVSRLQFPDRYDLIFVGSLITHLTPDDGMALLRALARVLEPDGILIFSTHCDISVQRLHSYGRSTARQAHVIRSSTLTHGAAYTAGDELTFHTPEWISSSMARFCPDLQFVYHVPQGWDNHQDVWAYRRSTE